MCKYGEYGICEMCPQEDCPEYPELYYDEDDDKIYEIINYKNFKNEWEKSEREKLKPYKRIALNEEGIVYGFLHLCKYTKKRNIAIETNQYIYDIRGYI